MSVHASSAFRQRVAIEVQAWSYPKHPQSEAALRNWPSQMLQLCLRMRAFRRQQHQLAEAEATQGPLQLDDPWRQHGAADVWQSGQAGFHLCKKAASSSHILDSQVGQKQGKDLCRGQTPHRLAHPLVQLGRVGVRKVAEPALCAMGALSKAQEKARLVAKLWVPSTAKGLGLVKHEDRCRRCIVCVRRCRCRDCHCLRCHRCFAWVGRFRFRWRDCHCLCWRRCFVHVGRFRCSCDCHCLCWNVHPFHGSLPGLLLEGGDVEHLRTVLQS